VKRVLVVDDDRQARRVLQVMLEQFGFESTAAGSGAEALERFQSEKIDLVLTDLRMPGMTGVEILTEIRDRDPDVPVIVLTAYGTVQSAVDAMKHGAFDFVLKPFDVETIEAVIRKALELRETRAENRYLRERVLGEPARGKLVWAAPAMAPIADLIARVGPTKSSVLITGETGTGKELVANAIHEASPRKAKLFVPLNCAAIPADLLESELFGHARGAFTGAHGERTGKFEVADGGTLFLDEIGDMPYELQAKLLRVLQEGVIEPIGSNRRIEVDVRVVSSTNRDLEAGMKANRFREDLYYRLNVFHLAVPPLRERREDIGLLAELFLHEFSRELGKRPPDLGADAVRLLEQHAWPGNVRELRNLMERSAVLCEEPVIDARFCRTLLPGLPREEAEAEPEPLELEPAVDAFERKTILRALAAAHDNKAQAARLLGVTERTLWNKLKKHGL
jgi:two-component system, NtrC family, response regulator AtoC